MEYHLEFPATSISGVELVHLQLIYNLHLVRHHLVAGDAQRFGEHGHPGIGHGVAQLRRDRGLHPLPLKVDPDPTGNVEEYR